MYESIFFGEVLRPGHVILKIVVDSDVPAYGVSRID